MKRFNQCLLILALLLVIAQVRCSAKKDEATTTAPSGISATVNSSKF